MIQWPRPWLTPPSCRQAEGREIGIGKHQEVWGAASERAKECSTAELLVLPSSKHPTLPDGLMWTALGQQGSFICELAEFDRQFVAVVGQSRPNPGGGSIACSSARSWSQIACNVSASALSCRLIGNASSHSAYCVCSSANSATASCQHRARLRWSVGRRVRITGVSAVRAARYRAWRSASVMALLPIDLRSMIPLPIVMSRNDVQAKRPGPGPRPGPLFGALAADAGLPKPAVRR